MFSIPASAAILCRMSDLDDMDDGDDLNLEGRIKLELDEISSILKNLDQTLPLLHEEIASMNANVERISEQLALFDANAEAMREAGALTEDMVISRTIGKVMIDIETGLIHFLEVKGVVLSVRMAVENEIAELRELHEELMGEETRH